MNEAIWNLLHDGEIVGIEGDIPGDVFVAVNIDYLRKMFSDDGGSIIVKLHACDLMEFRPDNVELVIKDLNAISKGCIWIYSGEQKEEEMIVFCGHKFPLKEKSSSGQLGLRYKDFSIFLDNNKPVSLNELDQKAEQYWDNFGNRK